MATKAIVLAAGKGTRMKTDLAKVLHTIAGRPMLHWVLDAVSATDCEDTVVVVGHQADAVRAILPTGIRSALQAEQLGTGHATAIGLAALEVAADDQIIVMPGDMPLVRGETLVELIARHTEVGAAATVLSVVLDEPASYGRVIRDGAGRVVAIIEVKDATPEQLAVTEVNTSAYVFSGAWLGDALSRLSTTNAAGEYYLTDVVRILVGDGRLVVTHQASPEEGMGVNSVGQIAEVESVIERRVGRSARPS
jgi:bifunctional UDP-N-acetylglucosamine pyrophosphorylase/glucosamine-1-phosphate N-acetyltransferase